MKQTIHAALEVSRRDVDYVWRIDALLRSGFTFVSNDHGRLTDFFVPVKREALHQVLEDLGWPVRQQSWRPGLY